MQRDTMASQLDFSSRLPPITFLRLARFSASEGESNCHGCFVEEYQRGTGGDKTAKARPIAPGFVLFMPVYDITSGIVTFSGARLRAPIFEVLLTSWLNLRSVV
jgi:hypothetical protein